MIASQACHATGRAAPPRLRPLLEEVREIFPPDGDPRAPGPPAGAVAALIGGKVFAGDAVSGW